jgi:UDP-glucose 4-epimerase
MVLHNLPGIFNVAADGVLALSEVIGLLGKRAAPVLPPWGTNLLAGPLRRFGLRIPDEMLAQLKFGRALENSKLKSTGFATRFTTAETVRAFGDYLRVNPVLKRADREYTYEREVEEFLRWSPNVQRPAGKGAADSDEPFGI